MADCQKSGQNSRHTNRPLAIICTGFPGKCYPKRKIHLAGETNLACVSPAKLPNTENMKKSLKYRTFRVTMAYVFG